MTLSQYSVPLHRLPSSWPAQSLSTLQSHVLVPDLQLPAPHTSPTVQPLPSSQLAVLLAWVHPVLGLHESSLHGFASSQMTATLMATPLHVPAPHTSPVVHALLSLQGRVLAV